MNPDLRLPDLDFCVVDTETTGGRAGENRVIEVAAFHYRDGIILDKFQTLLNPGCPIPEWITMLTGIDDGMVRGAPPFAEIAPRLEAFLNRGVFVAHNAGFDFGFLQWEFQRAGVWWERPRVCTVRLARQLFPELPSRSLGALCDHLMIEIFDRHRAGGDAEATVYVLKHLLQRLRREHGVETWAELEAFVSVGPLHLPPGVLVSHIARMPETPGRFVLKDAAGATVSEGTAKNLRRRFQNLFRASNQTAKAALFRQIVRSIEIAEQALEDGAKSESKRVRRSLKQLVDAARNAPELPPASPAV